METDFAKTFQEVLRLGLVDDRYPLDHACVQLPNGWYGIDSIITGFSNLLTARDYEEMLLPTVSTKIIFNSIPPALKGNIDERVLRITHTGKHALEEPFYLSGRPELVVPQVEKLNCRSYRDLPVRRLMKGFRYIKSTIEPEVSLITDTEFPAVDCEAILASEEEYIAERDMLVAEFGKFVEEKLKLTMFTAETDYARIYFVVLPNGTAMEVARLRLFGKDLCEAVEFQVLEPNNKFMSPYTVDLNITAKLFAGCVASHSAPGKVVLPMHVMRTFGTVFGDLGEFPKIRVEKSNLPFTEERFAKLIAQGGVFALIPADGKVEIKTEKGSEVVERAAVEDKVLEIMAARDAELVKKEKELYETKFTQAVQFIPKDAPAPEGFTIVGRKQGEPELNVAVRLFLPIE